MLLEVADACDCHSNKKDNQGKGDSPIISFFFFGKICSDVFHFFILLF